MTHYYILLLIRGRRFHQNKCKMFFKLDRTKQAQQEISSEKIKDIRYPNLFLNNLLIGKVGKIEIQK